MHRVDDAQGALRGHPAPPSPRSTRALHHFRLRSKNPRSGQSTGSCRPDGEELTGWPTSVAAEWPAPVCARRSARSTATAAAMTAGDTAAATSPSPPRVPLTMLLRCAPARRPGCCCCARTTSRGRPRRTPAPGASRARRTAACSPGRWRSRTAGGARTPRDGEHERGVAQPATPAQSNPRQAAPPGFLPDAADEERNQEHARPRPRRQPRHVRQRAQRGDIACRAGDRDRDRADEQR